MEPTLKLIKWIFVLWVPVDTFASNVAAQGLKREEESFVHQDRYTHDRMQAAGPDDIVFVSSSLGIGCHSWSLGLLYL